MTNQRPLEARFKAFSSLTHSLTHSHIHALTLVCIFSLSTGGRGGRGFCLSVQLPLSTSFLYYSVFTIGFTVVSLYLCIQQNGYVTLVTVNTGSKSKFLTSWPSCPLGRPGPSHSWADWRRGSGQTCAWGNSPGGCPLPVHCWDLLSTHKHTKIYINNNNNEEL